MSAKPRAAARPAEDDEDDGQFTRRIVAAKGAPPIAKRAVASVFELGGVPDKRRPSATTTRSLAHMSEIVIKKGVPLPPKHAGTGDRYRAVIVTMEVGDMAELPLKQARGLYAAAKKFGVECPPRSFAFRKLGADTAGVWRVS
jgi:hypothetical protein